MNAALAIFSALKSVPSENFESETLEFKEYHSEQALHNAKDLADEISAFANKEGGLIIIGVKDSNNVKNENWESQLTGFVNVDLDTTKERLLGKLRPKTINLNLEELSFDGKNFLLIHVSKQIDSLVSTTKGKYYLRQGKSSVPMEPDEITEAVKSLQDYDWSAEIIVDCDFEDILDTVSVKDAYSDFCKRREADCFALDHFYEAIGVTVNGQLTKSGLLMFGKRDAIKNKLGNFEYRFSKKTSIGELELNDIWDECLWATIKRSKEHFTKNNKFIALKYQGKTYHIPKLDEIAFHEAFINALVHRDYSIDGMVSIEFTDSQLTISSPGTFYGGIDPENIFTHEPRHRNKALARMLMEYHLVDRAGMGVFRMSLNSLKYGRKFPQFFERDDSVVVTMEADYFKDAIFIQSVFNENVYGIVEYLILNLIHEVGFVPVSKVLRRLIRIKEDPWSTLKKAVDNIDKVEFCGDKRGIYIRVMPVWNKFFDVQKTYRVYAGSENYVKLYDFLKQHGTVSNANVRELLGHKHTPTTSKFLRHIQYIKRTGKGVSAKWSLINQ